MSGYAGGYAINPFPTGPGVGTEATDKAVLYWDGVNNLIKGSSDLVFDATLKTLTLGASGSLRLPDGTAAAPSLAFSTSSARGFYLNSQGVPIIAVGADVVGFWSDGLRLASGSALRFGDNAALKNASFDTVLSRASAGVLSLSTGSAMYFPNGTAAAPAIAFASDTNNGISRPAEDQLQFNANNLGFFKVGNVNNFGSFAAMISTCQFGWTGGVIGDSLDTILWRDAANTLALRNSTNAQTFRIYNTYTDASNYERLTQTWVGNTFYIQTQKAGTGTLRNFDFGTATASWTVDTAGRLFPNTDLSFTLGWTDKRVKDAYVGGYIGGTVAKTADYTVAAGDHVILVSAAGANRTITLPAAASHTGRIIHIKKTDSSANYVRIDGNSTELVEDAQTQDLLYQGENLMLQCDGTQWWVL